MKINLLKSKLLQYYSHINIRNQIDADQSYVFGLIQILLCLSAIDAIDYRCIRNLYKISLVSMIPNFVPFFCYHLRS